MKNLIHIGLQFFAGEGAAPGAGDGAGNAGQAGNAGVNAAAPGQERELANKLGIPADKVERFRKSQKRTPATEPRPREPVEPEAETPPERPETEAPGQDGTKAKTLKELIKENPSYNEELQEIMQGRLQRYAESTNRAKEELKDWEKATYLLARKYGIEPNEKGEFDRKAIARAVEADDSLREQRAIDNNSDVGTQRQLDDLEYYRYTKRKEEEEELEQRSLRQHVEKLRRQEAQMKEEFPGFDLRTELENETFRRWVGPEIGMSVRDAYYALHREELDKARTAAIAQRMQEAMAANIAAGQARPEERGRSQGASLGQERSAPMTREERAALKQRILAAAARGEKIYPR